MMKNFCKRQSLIWQVLFNFWIVYCLLCPFRIELQAAWETGYEHRKEFLVQGALLDAAVTHYSLLIKTDQTDLFGCDDDGDFSYDIMFTQADGTTDLDIDPLECSKDGDSMLIIAYVSQAAWEIAATPADPTGYMYYENAGAGDPGTAEGVWDTNSKAIYDMDEASDASRLDSTSNNNDLTDNNTVPQGTLQVWKCIEPADANEESLYKADSVSLSPTGDITLEVWIDFDQLAGALGHSQYVLHKGDGWGNTKNSYAIMLDDGDDKIHAWYSGDGAWPADEAISDDALSDNTTYYIAFVKDNETGTLYIDGVAQSATQTGEGATVYDSDQELCIADQGNHAGGKNVDGLVDEVRISGIARTAAWIKFTEANLDEGDNELTFGGEESENGNGFIPTVIIMSYVLPGFIFVWRRKKK